MAEDALVTDKIEAGAKLLEALDRSDIRIKTAFWLHYPDQDSWKLVLAPGKKIEGTKDIYMKIGEILRSPELANQNVEISDIKIMQPDVPLLRALSVAIRTEGNKPIRFSRNVINGIYIDDALIYRNAA